jgi:hypothetical protein
VTTIPDINNVEEEGFILAYGVRDFSPYLHEFGQHFMAVGVWWKSFFVVDKKQRGTQEGATGRHDPKNLPPVTSSSNKAPPPTFHHFLVMNP